MLCVMPHPGAPDNFLKLQPLGVFFTQQYQPQHQRQHFTTPGLVSLLVSISWQGRSAAVCKMSHKHVHRDLAVLTP